MLIFAKKITYKLQICKPQNSGTYEHHTENYLCPRKMWRRLSSLAVQSVPSLELECHAMAVRFSWDFWKKPVHSRTFASKLTPWNMNIVNGLFNI
jgi:hypothetical protein